MGGVVIKSPMGQKDLQFLLQVESWLSDVDVDGDGQLSYAEFKMSLAGNLLIDI